MGVKENYIINKWSNSSCKYYYRHLIIDTFHMSLSMATEAYCVKCKAKRTMKDEKKVTMKNGKPAIQGTCTVCGTKMFKIGGK